jgi:hypothetical protein
MTLDQFIDRMQIDVEKFADYYIREKKRAPIGQKWPLKAPVREWFEQFLAWETRTNKRKAP